MNNLTNAKVDVQPYPFTTQNLFVGHTFYNYQQWQIIDTPGLLDRSIEQRNTIEMQSIAALAHLNAAILYMIDISETCGYSLEDQIKLLEELKTIYETKPLVIVLNKTDIKKWEDVGDEFKNKICDIAKQMNADLIKMSNVTAEGIGEVKEHACSLLLKLRLEKKLANEDKLNNIANRLHIAMPQKRDEVSRPISIPESVLIERIKGKPKRATIKEIQEQNGGAGVYSFPWEEHFLLENNDWKYDVPPEFFLGKNVADFIDPDINQKLEALEKEEALQIEAEKMEEPLPIIDKELIEEKKLILGKKKIMAEEHQIKRRNQSRKKIKSYGEVEEKFTEKGFSTQGIADNIRKRKTLAEESERILEEDNKMEIEDDNEQQINQLGKKYKKMSLKRTLGKDTSTITLKEIEKKKSKREKMLDFNRINKPGNEYPQYLFKGKMSNGTRRSR